MASPLVLPPLVKGKLYGYLKVVIDEVVWWREPSLTFSSKRCSDVVLVKMQWWGSNKPHLFRPSDVTHHDCSLDCSDYSQKGCGSCKTFEIRTNIKLFENYLKHCENLYLYVGDEKSKRVIGTVVIQEIFKILYDDMPYHSRYYPILNEFNNRIGDLHVCFNVKLIDQKENPIKIEKLASDEIKNSNLKLCKKHHSMVFKNNCKTTKDVKEGYSSTNIANGNNISGKKSKHGTAHTTTGKLQNSIVNQTALKNVNSVILGSESHTGIKCPPNTMRSVDGDGKIDRDHFLNRVLTDGIKLRNAMLLSIIKDGKQNDAISNDGFSYAVDKFTRIQSISASNQSIDESTKDCPMETFQSPLMSTLEELTLTDYLSGKPMSAREEKCALETLRSISPTDSLIEAAVTATTNHCEGDSHFRKQHFKEQEKNPEQIKMDDKSNHDLDITKNQQQQIRCDDLNDGVSGASSESKDSFDSKHLISGPVMCDTGSNINPIQLVNYTVPVTTSTMPNDNTSASFSKTLPHCNDVLNKIIKDIDCYRLTIEKLVLNNHGINKVNYIDYRFTTKNKKHKQVSNIGNLHLADTHKKTSKYVSLPPGQVYFLELDLENNKKKFNNRLYSPLRFCSRKFAGNVILFGHTLMKKITKFMKEKHLYDNCDTSHIIEQLLNHALNVKQWRVFLRHLNQRIPSLLGNFTLPSQASSECHQSDQNTFLSINLLEKHLFLPLTTNAGLIIGHLYVTLELGRDKKTFGYSLLGDNLLTNLKNRNLTEAEVQTDVYDTSKIQPLMNACENENNFLLEKKENYEEEEKAKEIEYSKTDNFSAVCQCCHNNKCTDFNEQKKNEVPGTNCQSNRKPADMMTTKTLPSFSDLKAFNGSDYNVEEICHIIIFNINSISECSLFNDMHEDISCYVEYSFPVSDQNTSSNNGVRDHIQMYSTGVVSSKIRPTFDYKHRHELKFASKPLCDALKMYTNVSSVSFSVWVRFYHPRPRDHMIATALLPFSKLYNLELQYCECQQNKNEVIEIMKLPLKLIQSSVTNSYLKMVRCEQNFGFLNLTVKYQRQIKNKINLYFLSEVCSQIKPSSGNIDLVKTLKQGNNVETLPCSNSCEQLKFIKYYLQGMKNKELPVCSSDIVNNLCCINSISGCECFCSIVRQHELSCFKSAFHSSLCCLALYKINNNNDNGINSKSPSSYCHSNFKKQENTPHQPQPLTNIVSNENNNYRNDDDDDDKVHSRSKRSNRDLIQLLNPEINDEHCECSRNKNDLLHYKHINSDNESFSSFECNKTDKNRIKNSKVVGKISTLKFIDFIDDNDDDGESKTELHTVFPCNMKSNRQHSENCAGGDDNSVIDLIQFNNCQLTSANNYFENEGLSENNVPLARNKHCIETDYDDNIILCDKSENKGLNEISTTVIREDSKLSENILKQDRVLPVRQSGNNFNVYENIPYNKQTDDHADSDSFFKVRIEIERALHLPLIKGSCDDVTEMIPPSTCAIIHMKSDDGNEENLATPVIKNTCNPCYNTVFHTSLPIKPLYQVFSLSVSVQAFDEFGHLVKEFIGSATINLNVFSNGFSSLRGWFNLLDLMGSCKGQIKRKA
ncbi:uncharacterized protein LOC142319132 isoform X2 [Lycorma delicatula]|uniref:uncharacterized protein LOC142319132 isoform X2 n=1 Tax=Lycorma delicatula TaxID=130591 RepID=UPI003F51A112